MSALHYKRPSVFIHSLESQLVYISRNVEDSTVCLVPRARSVEVKDLRLCW